MWGDGGRKDFYPTGHVMASRIEAGDREVSGCSGGETAETPGWRRKQQGASTQVAYATLALQEKSRRRARNKSRRVRVEGSCACEHAEIKSEADALEAVEDGVGVWHAGRRCADGIRSRGWPTPG